MIYLLAGLTLLSFAPKSEKPIGWRQERMTDDEKQAIVLPPRAPSDGHYDDTGLPLRARVIGVTASVSGGASQPFGGADRGPGRGWSSRAEAGLPLKPDLEGFRVTPTLALEYGRYGTPMSAVTPAEATVSSTLGLAGVRVEWEAVVRPAISVDVGWGWRSARQEQAGHVSTWGHTGLAAGIGVEATYDVTPRVAIGAHVRERLLRTMTSSQRESGAPEQLGPESAYTPVFVTPQAPARATNQGEVAVDIGIATWVDAGVHLQMMF